MSAYDPDNIFAKILRGEIPSQTIYEDDDVLAIMDVMPQAEGHALVDSQSPFTQLAGCRCERLWCSLQRGSARGKGCSNGFRG